MVQVINRDDDGNVISIFDSREYETEVENYIENSEEFKTLVDKMIVTLRKIVCKTLCEIQWRPQIENQIFVKHEK